MIPTTSKKIGAQFEYERTTFRDLKRAIKFEVSITELPGSYFLVVFYYIFSQNFYLIPHLETTHPISLVDNSN
jgi:hypothetical protein